MTAQVAQESTENKQNANNVQPKKHTAKEIIEFLNKKFPKCFFVENESIRPIKLGIIEDIVAVLGDEIGSEKEFSKTTIRRGLKAYANSYAYLKSCKEGAKRLDLDGNEGEELISEHIEYAAKRVEEIKKKSKELHLIKKPNSRKPTENGNRQSKVNSMKLPELVKVDISTLTIGDTVYVQMNNRRVRSNVSKIEKDGIYVKLRTGLVIKVKGTDVFQPAK